MPAPFEFGVHTVSIGELMEAPATQEIIAKHAQWAASMYRSEPFKPHRFNMTLLDMKTFIPGDHSKSIADVDAALKQLPKSEWPPRVQ
jgi:hypothetical protein